MSIKRTGAVVVAALSILVTLFIALGGPATGDTGQIGLVLLGVAVLLVGQAVQMLYLVTS